MTLISQKLDLMKYLLALPVVILLFSACSNTDPCPNADHPIEDIFSAFGNDEEFLSTRDYPSETHEYSFKMLTDGVICSVGYLADTSVSNYIIQILDANGATLVDESIKFPSDVLGFRPIPDVTVLANETYTIRRICQEYPDDDHLSGAILKADNVPIGTSILELPFTEGDISITAVGFYGKNEFPSNAIPRIEIGFEPN